MKELTKSLVTALSLATATLSVIPQAAAPAAVPQDNGAQRYVTIDFNDVDINLFIKYISELTRKNFVVDREVKGKVTIISPTRISEDDAYRVFRKMLESGHPPDDWDRLLAEAQKESQRLQESLARAAAAQ